MSALPPKPRAPSARRKKKDDEEQQTRTANRTARQTVHRRLKTGQSISLSPQDDRMIRLAYEFMAGYVKRHELQTAFDMKKAQFLVAAEEGGHPTDIDFEDYANTIKARKQGQDMSNRSRKKRNAMDDDDKSVVSGASDRSPAASLDRYDDTIQSFKAPITCTRLIYPSQSSLTLSRCHIITSRITCVF